METIVKTLEREFHISEGYLKNLITLFDDGATIPFIARYRKESHGSLNEQVIIMIYERLNYLRAYNTRKIEIIRLITDAGKMSDEIMTLLETATTLRELEDVYRPYRPKKETRVSIAIAQGLLPLAKKILAQKDSGGDLDEIAKTFLNVNSIDSKKQVLSGAAALKGASDIIAEMINDNAVLRKMLREKILKTGFVETQLRKADTSQFITYDNFKEPVKKIPPHRVLAINRGEKEALLRMKITMNEEDALSLIAKRIITGASIYQVFLKKTIKDSYLRLMLPSLEREFWSDLFLNATEQAIKVFGDNLRHLLMQPPLKDQTILGFDPGFKAGCKLAVVDSRNNVLATGVIYPHLPQKEEAKSAETLVSLIKKYHVNVIALGNGTATKESEIFISKVIKDNDLKVMYALTNEAGASIYSASKLAGEELPQYDLTLRSAISIARRLLDPLSELIKIAPKHLGVGQYQHDMPEARLKTVLDRVVTSVVSAIGVNVNTASKELLGYVSGINVAVAAKIVLYREKNGSFHSLEQLLKVPKLGSKTYHQAAGFLRIVNGLNPFDNTAIHPESYDVAAKLLQLLKLRLDEMHLFPDLTEIKIQELARELQIGIPTLKDIINELRKPGRDLRDEISPPVLRRELLNIKDLTVGLILDGIVSNVLDFGAFVDIGIHQDGLVHISEIANHFIKHPSEVLKIGDKVMIKIISLDVNAKRIGLTIKNV
ncbi:MAG: RNA-binding transcriptional accessory protein [Erysipelotrichaceae bacterium]|jgi:uncharacterized protein|nr:RNA-binding transcriptional accessory protein [Erysipelotrichaceae bacterium]